MKLVDLTCTKCGATLKVNSELTKCMCQYCGNEMLVDQEVQKHEFTNGFDFGYQAELGRQKAQQDLEIKKQQEIIHERNRLINTPYAYSYRIQLQKSQHRIISDEEIEKITRPLLKTNKILYTQYINNITWQDLNKQLVEAKQKEDEARKEKIEAAKQSGSFYLSIILASSIVNLMLCCADPYITLIISTIETIILFLLRKRGKCKNTVLFIITVWILIVLSSLNIFCTATNFYSYVYNTESVESDSEYTKIEDNTETDTQEKSYINEEYSEEPVNLDEVNYVDEETLSYRTGACLADALNLRLKGKMSEDDYNKYKNSVLELEMKILSCNTNGEDDSVYEQDVVNAENYLKQYYENSTESEYEFELEFSNIDGYKFTCSNDNDIKLYTNKYYDIYSGQANDLYYAVIPNGEYKIEYIGGENYLPDQVGRVCTNRWMGYSQITGEPINNDVYTVENVPDDNSEVHYEYEHFTCINRTTEGDGRITISNGDNLVIEDNTEQILEIYFDTDGKGLIKLYKIN